MKSDSRPWYCGFSTLQLIFRVATSKYGYSKFSTAVIENYDQFEFKVLLNATRYYSQTAIASTTQGLGTTDMNYTNAGTVDYSIPD